MDRMNVAMDETTIGKGDSLKEPSPFIVYQQGGINPKTRGCQRQGGSEGQKPKPSSPESNVH
jgi:hypothetical protein